MKCRFCKSENLNLFVDLGHTAISNSFLTKEQLNQPEVIYPLKAMYCQDCFLVQVDEYKKFDEIFTETYVYHSSISKSWLEHCKNYTDKVISRFNLNENSQVMEIASNDGYLLQYFKEKNIPCLGIEPTRSTANKAIEKGINTIVEFFGTNLATRLSELGKADLIIGNNVVAHVPDLNDFIQGIKILLSENGIITLEFPHLLKLIDNIEFDTIYQEHFSYFSLYTISKIFKRHCLEIFDVEELSTHGGSLRIYAKHIEKLAIPVNSSVGQLLHKELNKGVNNSSLYSHFDSKVKWIKKQFLLWLLLQTNQGKKIIGFGAAAKGNTFLNYCGVKNDLIDFIVDETPCKQNMYTPESHIPIVDFEMIEKHKPDFIIILPWNFKQEIMNKLEFVKEWRCKIVTCIPTVEIRW